MMRMPPHVMAFINLAKPSIGAPLKWLDGHLPALSTLILVLLLPNYAIFELEVNIYDVQTKLRYLWKDHQSVDNDVALILIDDESIRLDTDRLLVSPSPISRRYLARLIKKIVPSKPRVIAVDFLLDTPSVNERDDKELREALTEAEKAEIPVVLPTKFVEAGGFRYPILPIPEFLSDDARKNNLLFLGHSNVEKSQFDEVVRRTSTGEEILANYQAFIEFRGTDVLYYHYGNNSIYSLSFPLQIVRAGEPNLRRDDDATLNMFLLEEPVYIDFSYPSEEVTTISSSRIVAEEIQPTIAAKTVILGAGYSASADKHKVPLSATSFAIKKFRALGPITGPYTGALLNACSLLNLRRAMTTGIKVNYSSEWQLSAWAIMALIFILIICISLNKVHFISSVSMGLFVLYCGSSLLLFQEYLLYLPIIRPAALFLAGNLMVRYVRKRRPNDSEA